MNTMSLRVWSVLLLLAVLVALLLYGVAVVGAQNSGPDANERTAAPQGVGLTNQLSAADVAGQSPNGAGLDAAAPAGQNTLPLEAMVGRSPNGDDAAGEPLVASAGVEAVAAAGGTHFFISENNFNGAAADVSCPAGYHLASLWELADVTNLTYANIAGAKQRTDQGSGPVSGWWGWVRTGVDASVANQAGLANCNAWASSTSGEYGTLVRLSDNWTLAGTATSPWQAQTWSCGGIAPVWCVAD